MNSKPAKKASKPAKSSKLTKDGTKRLSKEEFSHVARFAAQLAHLNPRFQNERSKEERKAQLVSFKAYWKAAPSWIRARFADKVKELKIAA
jgi:hypothetical protein